MSHADFPLLSLLIFFPILGALSLYLTPKPHLAKKIALAIASLELLLTGLAFGLFNNLDGAHFQLTEQYAWIPSLHINYYVGIDGISVLFLPATAFLTLSAIMTSWNAIQSLQRFHFALILLLEGISIGVLSALDTLLFFVFWELTLPPLFFLIGVWGIGPKRRSAAMKYTLFMLFGGVPLLFAILLLAMNHATTVQGLLPKDLCFNLLILLETPVSDHLQLIVFSLFLLGFAAKAPLVPFHNGYPPRAWKAPLKSPRF